MARVILESGHSWAASEAAIGSGSRQGPPCPKSWHASTMCNFQCHCNGFFSGLSYSGWSESSSAAMEYISELLRSTPWISFMSPVETSLKSSNLSTLAGGTKLERGTRYGRFSVLALAVTAVVDEGTPSPHCSLHPYPLAIVRLWKHLSRRFLFEQNLLSSANPTFQKSTRKLKRDLPAHTSTEELLKLSRPTILVGNVFIAELYLSLSSSEEISMTRA